MKKSMPTFQVLDENMQKAVVEKVAVKRKAGFSGSATGEERRKKQEELMPPLSEEAPPPKQTLRNVSSQKEEKIVPTLPSGQVISPPIAPTKEQSSNSPTAVSRVPPTNQRKRNQQCVHPSSSPQGPPQRRKGKEMVGDVLQLINEAPATFLMEQLQADKLVMEQDKEKLNKEKQEQQTAVANLQVEKSALTNQLQECEGELATVKMDLSTIRASWKKATTTVTKLNGNLLVSNLLLEEEKEKVCKLEQKLDTAKISLTDRNSEILLLKNEKVTQEAQIIRDFLRSRAFQTSAFLALLKHFPFFPQEVRVQGPVNVEAPDLSSYCWNRKSDKLISEDGIVLDHPTTLPNLSELHVGHPWIGPFPTLVSEDEKSEENKSKMILKNKDEEHREKDG